MRVVQLFIFLSLTGFFFAQPKDKAYGINDCKGAISIFKNGNYDLQFLGKPSTKSIVSKYSSLDELSESNQLWVSFVASNSGLVYFKASKKQGYLQMVVFKQEKDICEEINRGIAEIERLHLGKTERVVGLDDDMKKGILYPIKLQKGEKIVVLFTTTKADRSHINLSWFFKTEITNVHTSKVIDKRTDDFAPTFSISLRDKKTNKPIVGTILIKDSKTFDGYYTASDLLLNVERRSKIIIETEVPNYHLKDTILNVSPFDNQELILKLSEVEDGQQVVLEDIEFVPGTSEVTEKSYPKLKRLKDFMLLNSNISIEIQGHVYAPGKNSMLGQRISEARAKRVKKYLIDHGVDKNRIRTKGFGNTKPIYEKPRFSYEEQANRRVEILILGGGKKKDMPNSDSGQIKN